MNSEAIEALEDQKKIEQWLKKNKVNKIPLGQSSGEQPASFFAAKRKKALAKRKNKEDASE